MNTLKVIQTLAKVAKILNKILFICCIVGFCLCVVGIVSLALGAPTLKLGGVTLESFVQKTPAKTVGTVYAALAAGAILCVGEGILSKFAVHYFDRELRDGTPFTLDGVRELTRLGILTILIPVASQIVSQIVCTILSKTLAGVSMPDTEGVSSVSVGVMILIAALLCRYGAEQAESRKEEQTTEEPERK